jgi:hypothetical protein
MLTLPPARVAAKDVPQITLNVGQPNVWSLSQAHYLLALLRNNHRELDITSPTLNPNAVNGARVDILRTMLGIDAQFSAPQGLQNSVAQQQFTADFARKQSAIARVDELSRERINVVREISRLDSELAKLPAPPKEGETPNAETEQRRSELTKTKEAQQALNTALQAEITTQSTQAAATTNLSNLQTGAPFGAAAGLPALPNDFDNIKALVEKLLGTTATPSVNASQALDSYINFQYEKLAKELTLLRDEVGPSERLIFLELPSSLYSIPKKDDDFMVQLEWDIDDYVGRCPERRAEPSEAEKTLDYALTRMAEIDPNSRFGARLADDISDSGEDEDKDNLALTEQKPPLTEEAIDEYLTLRTNARLDIAESLDLRDRYAKLLFKLKSLEGEYQRYKQLSITPDTKAQTAQELRALRLQQAERQKAQAAHNLYERVLEAEGLDELQASMSRIDALASKPEGRAEINAAEKLRRFLRLYPSLRGAGRVDLVDENGSVSGTTSTHDELCVKRAESSKFRVVDIIPRQSALNVNDVHATQKGWALAAQFLSLFGFGGKVSYERQRTHYEQFINQDVFASGFGKGLSRFGWTMGPLPGTKRLAPGPRTTFAVMAIPKEAQQVTLRATGKAFKRNKNPGTEGEFTTLTGDTGKTFDVVIPNEATEGFWVDSINYTPVPKGQRVTTVIGGRYFSPLTGVMVDGIPLKRAIAIAKHESETTTLSGDTNAPGEYEYINSNQIVATFTRTTAGTPLITLISPEKTAAINYFRDLKINFHFTDSLLHHSQSEPMFIDSFALTRLEVRGDPSGAVPVTATLVGTGLRRRAEIQVNGIPVLNPQLLNTGVYSWQITNPQQLGQVWNVTYRVGQDAGSVVFDVNTDGLRADAPTIESIENPNTGNAQGLVDGGYTVIIRGRNLQYVTKISFGSTVVPAGGIKQRHPNVLLVEVPKRPEGGVHVLLEGTVNGRAVSNILDFATPNKAIFKYLPPPKPEKPEGQQQQQQQNKEKPPGSKKKKPAQRPKA